MGKYKPRWTCTQDANHKEITQALEKIGCSVYDASKFGGGFPDVIVGYRGKCFLLEYKHGKGKLNPKQIQFRDQWNGNYCVVRTPEEAIQAVTTNG